MGPRPRRASFAAPSRSRSRKPSQRRRRSSSASSRPRRPSPSPPPRSRRQDLKDRVKDDAKDAKKDTALKTSLAFLGAVGAATYVASKYWPKGILYGEKEEWEKEDIVRHHGKPARGSGHSRHSPPHRPAYQKSRTAEALGPRMVPEDALLRRDRDGVVYEEIEVVKRPAPLHSRSEGVSSMVAQAGKPRQSEARRGGPGPRRDQDEHAVPRTVAEYSIPQRNNAPPGKVPPPGRPVREEYIRYEDARR